MLINADNFKRIYDKKTTYIKNFTNFDIDYDFNFLIDFLEEYTCRTNQITHNGSHYTTWQVYADDYHAPFNLIKNYLRITFKYEFDKLDGCEIFYSYSSNSGPSHVDQEDVFLLGLCGKTIYRVNNNFYTVERGDLLFVSKGVRHKAISVTPRIVASFGFFGDRK